MSRLIWRFYDNFYLDPWPGMHFGTTSTTSSSRHTPTTLLDKWMYLPSKRRANDPFGSVPKGTLRFYEFEPLAPFDGPCHAWAMPRSWSPARRPLLAALLLALCTTACPGKKTSAPKPCRQAFEQCQLADGPLGVCQEVSCAEGQLAPCFNCVSQH